jgi:hypothetical protein
MGAVCDAPSAGRSETTERMMRAAIRQANFELYFVLNGDVLERYLRSTGRSA